MKKRDVVKLDSTTMTVGEWVVGFLTGTIWMGGGGQGQNP